MGSTTSTFTWDDEATPNVLTDGTNTYLYGPDGLPIEQIGASGNYWFVHDETGSTLALLNATGSVAGGYTYTPFGGTTHSGTATTPLQYTGQYTDAETGLVYLHARYYDPQTAEFVTVDPQVAKTGTPNAYTDDDPLNLTDRTGQLFGLDDLIGAGIGFIAGGAGSLIHGALTGHVDWTDVGIGAVSGAVFGGLVTTCGFCAGFAASATSDFLTQLHDNGGHISQVSGGEVLGEGVVGGLVGGIGDGFNYMWRSSGVYSAQQLLSMGRFATRATGFLGIFTGGFDPISAIQQYDKVMENNDKIAGQQHSDCSGHH